MGKKIYLVTAGCMAVIIFIFSVLDKCNIGTYIGLSVNYDWLAFIGNCVGILVSVYIPIYVLYKTLEHEKENALRAEKRSVSIEIMKDISALISLHKKAVYYFAKSSDKEYYKQASIEFWGKYSFIKMRLSSLLYDDKYTDTNELLEALKNYATPAEQINNRCEEEKNIMDLFLVEPQALWANDKCLISATEKFVEKNIK